MTSPHASTPSTPDAPASLAALVAFVETLESWVRQDGSGSALLSPRGTYTFTQTVQHAAQSIGYSMTGYPRLAPVSLRVTVGRAVKHLFLSRGAMRHNLSAPVSGAPELDTGLPDLAAIELLRTTVNRLAAFDGVLQPHPTYGRCTKEQVASLQTLHLREHLPGVDQPLSPTVGGTR